MDQRTPKGLGEEVSQSVNTVCCKEKQVSGEVFRLILGPVRTFSTVGYFLFCPDGRKETNRMIYTTSLSVQGHPTRSVGFESYTTLYKGSYYEKCHIGEGGRSEYSVYDETRKGA